MKQRGGQRGAIVVKERPSPPAHMGAAAAAEWQSIVDALPPDWFGRENWPLLEAYCNSVVNMRWLDAQSTKMREDESEIRDNGLDFQLFGFYRQQASKEAQLLANLATKLRLTQQSTVSKEKTKDNTGAGPKPWDE